MVEALTRLIELGGPVVLILLSLSVMGAAVVIYKLLQLRPYSTRRFASLKEELPVSGSTDPIDEIAAWVRSSHTTTSKWSEIKYKKQSIINCIFINLKNQPSHNFWIL